VILGKFVNLVIEGVSTVENTLFVILLALSQIVIKFLINGTFPPLNFFKCDGDKDFNN
jgi:hypothetical protein